MMAQEDSGKEEALRELARCLKETYSEHVRYLVCKEELESHGYIIFENGIDKVKVLKEVL